VAQLFLVTGAAGSLAYTPLFPTQSFRTEPAGSEGYFVQPVTVIVPGVPGGTTGTRFVIRAWHGPSYDTATLRGESHIITVTRPLGGLSPGNQSPPIVPPDLGGPLGFGSASGISQGFAAGFAIIAVPEPSTFSLALFGAAALLFRCRNM
jgi:hypothetical protein